MMIPAFVFRCLTTTGVPPLTLIVVSLQSTKDSPAAARLFPGSYHKLLWDKFAEEGVWENLPKSPSGLW